MSWPLTFKQKYIDICVQSRKWGLCTRIQSLEDSRLMSKSSNLIIFSIQLMFPKTCLQMSTKTSSDRKHRIIKYSSIITFHLYYKIALNIHDWMIIFGKDLGINLLLFSATSVFAVNNLVEFLIFNICYSHLVLFLLCWSWDFYIQCLRLHCLNIKAWGYSV